MNKYLLSILTVVTLISHSAQLFAQEFTITSAGERDLDTNQITEEGKVSRYLGIHVFGAGSGFIRINAGDFSVQKSFEFKLSDTLLRSFIFDDDLAEVININFRRGVFGNFTVDILNASGELQDSRNIFADVTLKKSNCRKHQSKKLTKCERVNIDKATLKLRKVFAQKVLDSIKGPIILEP